MMVYLQYVREYTIKINDVLWGRCGIDMAIECNQEPWLFEVALDMMEGRL